MTLDTQASTPALPLTAWLDVISAVFPPRGVVVVGAGTGQGPWVQWLCSRRLGPVCLVEGDEAQYWHLQRHVPDGCQWTLRRDVVAERPGPAVFYRASNASESGLIDPQHLRALWPNLERNAAIDVDAAITLEALLAEVGEQTNWLVLDCLPAAPILAGAARRLSQLDVVLVRVAVDGQEGVDEGALHPTVDARLKSAGLVCVHARAERHPALAQALYVRDLSALQAQLVQQTRSQMTQRLSQVEELKVAGQLAGLFTLSARLNHLPALLVMNTAHPDWLRVEGDDVEYAAEAGKPLYVLSKEDGDFNAAPEKPQLLIEPELEYVLSGRVVFQGDIQPQVWIFQCNHEKRIASHSVRVDESGYFRLSFKALAESRSAVIGLRLAGQGRIHGYGSYLHLFEQVGASTVQKLETNLRDAESRQLREIKNAVLQIESFIRIQHYLGPDVLAPEMHHWAVSPDFGLMLVELVESHDYDAVIEFGSGTSTLLLAKSIQRLVCQRNRGITPLLSLEHLEEYQQKTLSLLERAGLSQYAQVELAPLSSWQSRDGREFSYYSCDMALKALRDSVPSTGGLLMVVVDGPPAATGYMARYPALAHVLNAFGSSFRFHFLIDDYVRTDEQEMVKAWEADLTERDLKFKRTEFSRLEKGGCLLEVYPAGDASAMRGNE